MKKPYLIVEWNDCETEAKGWLVVHNFVKGYAGGRYKDASNSDKRRSRAISRGNGL